MTNIGEILYDEFHRFGYNPCRKKTKFCTAKIASWFIPEAKSVIHNWGKDLRVDNSKAREIMQMEFRDLKKTVIDMGYSLIASGYVPDRVKS